VYERVGGHAYGSVYPGPIGAILSPQMSGEGANSTLPYASTLCGACFDACPVRINIPEVLVHLRQIGPHPRAERAAMRALSWAMRDRRRYTAALRAARRGAAPVRWMAGRRGTVRHLPWPLSKWTSTRDAPLPAKRTFREWWANERGDG
jgi:L-lactate dehydrogenase complex protein LldF